ncbi:DUF3859 domain-containing protein [Pseudomonas borbori]
MRYNRFSLLMAFMLSAPLASAEVRVEGAVEYGIFSQYEDFEPGQRVLTRSNQEIQRTDVIPAKLGTKFGVRYSLAGKVINDSPLTLLYLTPGVVTAEGKRHDKFVVTQALVPGTAQEVMAFEFSEPHEIVAGTWHFMVFQDDRKLVEQRFEVR